MSCDFEDMVSTIYLIDIIQGSRERNRENNKMKGIFDLFGLEGLSNVPFQQKKTFLFSLLV